MAAAAAAAAKKSYNEDNFGQFYEGEDHLDMDNDQDQEDDDDEDDDQDDDIDHNKHHDYDYQLQEQRHENEIKLTSIDRDFTRKSKKNEIQNSLVNPFSPFQQHSTFDSTQPSQCSGYTRLFQQSAQGQRRISTSEMGDMISSHQANSNQNLNAQLQIKAVLLSKTLQHAIKAKEITLKSQAFNSIEYFAQLHRLKEEHVNQLQEANIQNMKLKCKLKDYEKSLIELAGKFQAAEQGYLRKKDELKIAIDERQRIKKISVEVAKKSYQVEDELKEMREQNEKCRLKISATIKWVAMSESLRIVNHKVKMLQFKKQYKDLDKILDNQSS